MVNPPMISPFFGLLAIAVVLLLVTEPCDAQIFRSWDNEPGQTDSPPKSGFLEKLKAFGQSAPVMPAAYSKPPSRNTLIADLNARAVRIKQVKASVRIKLQGTPVKLRGTLQVEFPRKMRIKAGFNNMSELGFDAGSNDELFWVWVKAALPKQPPAMYFARHDEFQTSRFRQQIPLEPQWLIDALGITRLDPADAHIGPFQEHPGFLTLVTPLETPRGQVQYRQLLIDERTGNIQQVAIYEGASRRLIAYSNAEKMTYIEKYNVSLPEKIRLVIIEPEKQEFEIELGGYQINALHGDPKQMWSIPLEEANDVKKFNLGLQ